MSSEELIYYIKQDIQEMDKLNKNGIFSNIHKENNTKSKKYGIPVEKINKYWNFSLINILSYNFTKEPEDILDDYEDINNEITNYKNYWNMYSNIENIHLNPSITLFHDLNSIHLIYKATIKELEKPITINKMN
jgi:hypothetical protein